MSRLEDGIQTLIASDSVAQSDPVCAALVSDVRKQVLSDLRQKYIWMPEAGVKQIAESVASALEEGIKTQQPLIAAAKSRMNIFRLPFELRELIYRPVLAAHSEGNGRVNIPVSREAPPVSTIMRGAMRGRWGRPPNVAGGFSRGRGRGYDAPQGFICGYGSPFFASQPPAPHTPPPASFRLPALFETSRQVRVEAEKLFYSTTTFCTSRYLPPGLNPGVTVNNAQRWLDRIGPRRRSMVKKLIVIVVLPGLSVTKEHRRWELQELMRRMAAKNNPVEFDNLHGFNPLDTHPFFETLALPAKLRTTAEWLLEYIGMDVQGLGEGVVEVRYCHSASDWDEKVISRTEVFCPLCCGRGEPDSAEFRGGIYSACKKK